MIYRLRIPRPPLSDFVENLWFYQDLATDHSREKLAAGRLDGVDHRSRRRSEEAL